MAGEWRINSSYRLSEDHRGVAEQAEKTFRKLCDLRVSAVQSIRLLIRRWRREKRLETEK